MEIMEKLNKAEIREFFSKNWMTHDAMWYGNVLRELGADKANELNKAAVKAMAGIEIKRISKLMGKPKDAVVITWEELKEIIDTVYKLIQPEFMKLYYDFPERNIFRGGFHECFAYDGVRKFIEPGIYQCGIVIRVQGWLEGLGVKYEMTPEFTGCLMHQNGKCEIEFKFNLD